MSILRLETEDASVHSEPPPGLVVILSRDRAFREALATVLEVTSRRTLVGEDQTVFSDIAGWLSDWRGLEGVEAVVIDLGTDVLAGVDALDAIRRRDPNMFVIVLGRGFATAGKSQLGANLILEGKVNPATVAAALAQRVRSR